MTDREWLKYIVEWLENAGCDVTPATLNDLKITAGDLMTPYRENGWSLQKRIKEHLDKEEDGHMSMDDYDDISRYG